jgi:hypothetical protein
VKKHQTTWAPQARALKRDTWLFAISILWLVGLLAGIMFLIVR